MKNKKILLAIPSIILPYVLLLVLFTIFSGSGNPISRFIIEDIFAGNGLLLFLAFCIFTFISFVLNIIFFVLSITKKWDELYLAKVAMITKLIQIPSYIVIFVLGVLLTITIFTFVFSILMFFFDYLTLIMTGLINSAAVINASRKKAVSFGKNIWIIILQFVFCADVVASIIFYIKIKNIRRYSENDISKQ